MCIYTYANYYIYIQGSVLCDIYIYSFYCSFLSGEECLEASFPWIFSKFPARGPQRWDIWAGPSIPSFAQKQNTVPLALVWGMTWKGRVVDIDEWEIHRPNALLTCFFLLWDKCCGTSLLECMLQTGHASSKSSDTLSLFVWEMRLCWIEVSESATQVADLPTASLAR